MFLQVFYGGWDRLWNRPGGWIGCDREGARSQVTEKMRRSNNADYPLAANGRLHELSVFCTRRRSGDDEEAILSRHMPQADGRAALPPHPPCSSASNGRNCRSDTEVSLRPRVPAAPYAPSGLIHPEASAAFTGLLPSCGHLDGFGANDTMVLAFALSVCGRFCLFCSWKKGRLHVGSTGGSEVFTAVR